MKFRKLRIAWSVLCGIFCVLLIVLWLRSYWVIDGIVRDYQGSGVQTRVSIIAVQGTLMFARHPIGPTDKFRDVIDHWTYYPAKPKEPMTRRFWWYNDGRQFAIRFPTWLPVPFLALAASAPWVGLPFKFSLRTLLIATFFAVTLGLIVWLAHR
jgi:hypothetical protein